LQQEPLQQDGVSQQLRTAANVEPTVMTVKATTQMASVVIFFIAILLSLKFGFVLWGTSAKYQSRRTRLRKYKSPSFSVSKGAKWARSKCSDTGSNATGRRGGAARNTGIDFAFCSSRYGQV
jgi:hypothetical protein